MINSYFELCIFSTVLIKKFPLRVYPPQADPGPPGELPGEAQEGDQVPDHNWRLLSTTAGYYSPLLLRQLPAPLHGGGAVGLGARGEPLQPGARGP